MRAFNRGSVSVVPARLQWPTRVSKWDDGIHLGLRFPIQGFCAKQRFLLWTAPGVDLSVQGVGVQALRAANLPVDVSASYKLLPLQQL